MNHKLINKLFFDKSYQMLIMYKSELVWNYITRLIIESSFDFEFANIVRNNHYKLIDFYIKYPNIKRTKNRIKNISLTPEEKEKYRLTPEFINFQRYFYKDLDLLRIIKSKYNSKFITSKFINLSQIRYLNILINQLNQLEIKNIELSIEINNLKYFVNFEYFETDINDIIIKELSTNLIIFTLINNLNYKGIIKINNEYYINVYYSLNSKNTFEQLLFIKNLINELKFIRLL